MKQPLGLNDITILPPPTQNPERAYQIYHHAFARVIEYITYSKIPGEVLEFGTFHGYTARTLADLMALHQTGKELHLFDSWEGFPEMTGNDALCPEVKAEIWKKGSCMPLILDPQNAIKFFLGSIIPGLVHAHKGFYEQTVPAELPKKAALVHIDCDLYESTYHVLKEIINADLLSQGSVILFDDWNNNFASNKFGERAAVRELFPFYYEGIRWGRKRTDNGNFVASELGLESWFTYGSSGHAFIVHKDA